LLAVLGAGAGFRYAVHTVPWVGPLAADSLRRVLGRDAVTRLEEGSAKIEDLWRRSRPGSRAPRSIQEVARPPAAEPSTKPGTDRSARPPPFLPHDVGPMIARVAARGDGVWRPVADPARPTDVPLLFTTMLHPDVRRPWSEAFVVAVRLADVRLFAKAGSVEPKATAPGGRGVARSGLIPHALQPELLAVFNGGFKTEHGQHGMFVDGVMLVPARAGLCTIVGFDDGSARVATWATAEAEISQTQARVSFWRQGAPCLVENGKPNPALRDEGTRRWGATLEGETVIRRSAVGLDAKRATLFVAVTNDTTAAALANAMLHAGATDVAQLDVNWSYPKFVLFPRDSKGIPHAESLFEGFLVGKDDFVRRASPRDFFYLTVAAPALPP
jgi:hypothetical protein